jgi:dienelactone hydrolase
LILPQINKKLKRFHIWKFETLCRKFVFPNPYNMKNFTYPLLAISILALIAACSNQAKPETQEPPASFSLKEEKTVYSGDSVEMSGYVAYDGSTDAKRPIVLVVHEWWGQTDYPRKRAQELAKLGYLAFAVDMFGEGKVADDPATAEKYAMPFYMDPVMAKRRFDAALAKAKSHPLADTTQVAAIGYCFGGSMVLNMARLGENLDGVVSFHGNLNGVPPSKDKLKAAVLVCHGEADKFVSAQDVTTFKRQMDSIGAKYTFKSYPNATHAFTNPAATEKGKKFNMPIEYNAQADTTSWNDMKTFFGSIFKK